METDQIIAAIVDQIRSKLKPTSTTPAPTIDRKSLEKLIVPFLESCNSSIYENSLKLVEALASKSLKKNTVTNSPGFQVLLITQDYINRFISDDICHWTEELALKSLSFGISQKNQSWLEIIIVTYHVERIPRQNLVMFTKELVSNSDYLNAAWIVIKFGFHKEFTIEEIPLPLLIQNKVNVMETYMKGDEEIAKQIVSFLDKCNRNIDPLYNLINSVPDARRDQINVKTINKLTKRLAKAFEMDATVCPNANYWTCLGALKFLIGQKYNEKKIDDATWNDMIIKTVSSDVSLQEELVITLSSYSEAAEAKKWALHFNIPQEKWPYSLLNEPATQVQDDSWALDWGQPEKEKPKQPEPTFPELKMHLEKEDIILVETDTAFSRVIKEISYNYDLIGYDSEWRPTLGLLSNAKEKVALIQIATWDNVYLIDSFRLKDSPIWELFIKEIICNQSLMKIGYSITNDFKSLRGLLTDHNFQPQNVLDLAVFAPWIQQHIKASPIKVPEDIKGLSKLVCSLLGKCLNKSEQFSNWENRPLTSNQIHYAAIDAYCLLLVYEKLYQECENKNLNFCELFTAFREGKVVKPKKPSNLQSGEGDDEFKHIKFNPTSIRSFKCVVDTMLQGLGRNLRLLGANTVILASGQHHDYASRIARRERRFILSSGQPYQNLKTKVPPGYCFQVSNAYDVYEQTNSVVAKYNLVITEDDLFSRCVKCNCDIFKVINQETMKVWSKNKREIRPGVKVNYSALSPVNMRTDNYFICEQCGQIYWKGYHHGRVKDCIKSLLVSKEKANQLISSSFSHKRKRPHSSHHDKRL